MLLQRITTRLEAVIIVRSTSNNAQIQRVKYETVHDATLSMDDVCFYVRSCQLFTDWATGCLLSCAVSIYCRWRVSGETKPARRTRLVKTDLVARNGVFVQVIDRILYVE